MIQDPEKLADLLLQSAYISSEDLQAARDFCSRTSTVNLIDYLLERNIITKELLNQAIAEGYHVPYINVKANPPSKEQVERLPEPLARQYTMFVAGEDEKKIQVVTADPTQMGLLSELLKALNTSKVIELNYGDPHEIERAFIHYQKPLSVRLQVLFENKGEMIAPKIFDEILKDALFYQTSDIHMEPQEEYLEIRFRIDGLLHEMARLPKVYCENLINHIKVQAHLKIDEHFSAQDGAIHYMYQHEKVDMRISIVPVIDGEKIVIRLLSKDVQNLTLNDLGLSGEEQEILVRNAKKPYGMILVTGPTGSGKSTTLYSILKKINSPEINIATIEDPVEYKIPSVNHIQVNEQTNLTFAKGLRSIVRQDPDIILVGEIRDKETAEVAINAALTGHLLLSTFHANDSVTAIPRLLDMGAEPFLMASTLELIMAQRLVRRICMACRYSSQVNLDTLEAKWTGIRRFFPESTLTLYQGKGCVNCNHTGYQGRVGVFEFLEVTAEIKELVLKHPSKSVLWEAARKNGTRSMFENGLDKVKNGLTTLDELARVVAPA